MRDPIADLKHELLAAAERQHQQHVGANPRDRRLRLSSSRKRLTLTAVTVAAAAAAALFVSSPWKTTTGFSLEAVQAALTPPEGTILHATWTISRTSKDYGCTVSLGPNELWADLSAPYRYRLIDSMWPSGEAVDRRSAACNQNESLTTELGGTPGRELRFEPPDKLLPYGPGYQGGSMDDVAQLRTALADGRAHEEGPVELDGQVVERIRVDIGSGTGILYYVDRETLIPVRVEVGGGLFASKRLGYLHFGPVVRHMSTYEFLPRTDENLALTDIRDQHPDVTSPLGPQAMRDRPTLTGAVARTVRAAEGAKSARATFTVTATDNEGGGIPVSCQPKSGSRFPLGETLVFCTATDSRGNFSTAAFNVTVRR